MSEGQSIDEVLVRWGDRHFYPANRIIKGAHTPSLSMRPLRERANAIRGRIEATVARRAPQVMVKVTGGGRGMKAITAHFKYISKNGRLDVENDRGETLKGRGELRDLADEWRLGGSPIDEVGYRREAFNIMMSMPRGVDALYVQKAAREFAREEFADHKYIMVLHDHQANPHVHLSVRAESRTGRRLNPRKADLQRWRAMFAEKLRGLGIEAEASSRSLRGTTQGYEPLWRIKARQDGRLKQTSAGRPRQGIGMASAHMESWTRLSEALSKSTSPDDRRLGIAVGRFLANESRAPERAFRLETGAGGGQRDR